MNRGVPPTALKARTGEFTPPGVTAWARANRAADSAVCRAVGSELIAPFSPRAPSLTNPDPAVRL
jgi:hypothetical protein